MNINIDKKIAELQNQYNQLDTELEEVSDKINDIEQELSYLEDESDDISNQMTEIQDEINSLKSKMLDEKMQDLDVETNDTFLKDFITASYFCERISNVRPMLNYVNITDKELQACNGYVAIIIKNNHIPECLKNKKVKWDIREDFESNINNEIGEFIRLSDIYPKINEYSFRTDEIMVEDFKNILKVEIYKKEHNQEIVTITTDKEILVNKNMLDTSLLAFKGEKFNFYSGTEVTPITLGNANKSVLLLPTRKIR